MPLADLPPTSTRLDRRLFSYMATALVPLAALAFIFSYVDHLRSAEEEQARFVDYARLIGQSSAKIIARTEGYAAALAVGDEADFQECAALFDAMRKELRQAVGLRVMSAQRIVCESRLEQDRRGVLSRQAANSQDTASIPVLRANKKNDIFVEIGLRPQSLLAAPIAATISSQFSFALLDNQGTVLASYAASSGEGGDFSAFLNDAKLQSLPLKSPYKTVNGWRVAVVTLPGTEYLILTGAPPSTGAKFEPWMSVAKALLLPISLLAIVFVVLRFGTQRFLLRYIRHIYATFRRYGSGNVDARVGNLDQAPAEIKLLGLTFDMMADRIAYRTHDLEESLAEQQRLTRELHHRIKNTLQMISSLLGLQRREAKLPCEQAVLRIALERVLGISAAYRVSYASNEGTDVALEALVREVVESLREPAMVPRSAVKITTDGGSQSTLVLDKAIPLAFILAELLPSRFSDLVPGEVIEINLTGGAHAVLEISGADRNEAIDDGNSDVSPPLKSRLMRAYLGQLSATCETAGTLTRLELPLDNPV